MNDNGIVRECISFGRVESILYNISQDWQKFDNILYFINKI